MGVRTEDRGAAVDLVVRGTVAQSAQLDAHRRLADFCSTVGGGVSTARLRITAMPDRAGSHLVVAQANLGVDGRSLRAQAGADSVRTAVDEVMRRLRSTVAILGDGSAADPTLPVDQVPATGALRDLGSAAVRRQGERRLVRRKSVRLLAATVDEAALVTRLMGYDFLLFTETVTGQDSVLYREDAGGYGFTQPQPDPAAVADAMLPVVPAKSRPLRLRLDHALIVFGFSPERFRFFYDVEHGRGTVLYRRLDGDFGLIAPSGDRPAEVDRPDVGRHTGATHHLGRHRAERPGPTPG